MSFAQAFIVAVMGGVISALVTNAVKAYFDRGARREEWRNAQDRWVLEKSARNAEEIVTVLEKVSKGLSFSAGVVSQEVSGLRMGARVSDRYEEEIDSVLSRINQAQTKHMT